MIAKIGKYTSPDHKNEFSIENYNKIILIKDFMEDHKEYDQYDLVNFFENLVVYKYSFFIPEKGKVKTKNYFKAKNEDMIQFLANFKEDLESMTTFLSKHSRFTSFNFKHKLKFYLYYNQFALMAMHFYNSNEWLDSFYVNFNNDIKHFTHRNMETMVMSYEDVLDDVIEDFYGKDRHNIIEIYNFRPDGFKSFLNDNENKMRSMSNKASTILQKILNH